MQTEVKEGNAYYSSNPLRKESKQITRSNKYNLIERGSVFFFNDNNRMEAFANKLKGNNDTDMANFYKIGYNNFIEIKSN